MFMNKLLSLLFACCVATMSFMGCSEDDPFITATEDDFPQILLPWFGEFQNGEPYEYKNLPRDIEFEDSVVVTPALHTKVEWFLDGEKVHEGKKYKRTFLAGNYIVKIVATTTKGLSTSRTGKVVVRPIDGDPVLANNAAEYLVAPGVKAVLTGTNLNHVKKLAIGSQDAEIVSVSDSQIEYIVPQMADGTYSVTLSDEAMTYGGVCSVTDATYTNCKLVVTSAPYVANPAISAKAGLSVEWTGINLDKVQSIQIGEKEAVITGQSSTSLIFTCPDLAAGEYPVAVSTKDGQPISFGGEDSFTIRVTEETTIYTGPSAKLAWSAFEDLRETWAECGIDVGTVITVYVTADADAVGAIATGWWNKINDGTQWETEGEVVKTPLPVGKSTMTYTVKTTEYIQEQGFAVIGNGFVIDKITIK